VAGARGQIVPHTVKQALERYALEVSPSKDARGDPVCGH